MFVYYQIISAQQLPKDKDKHKSIVDPLVRVEIHGVPADNDSKETDYIENNGILRLFLLHQCLIQVHVNQWVNHLDDIPGFKPMWNKNFQFTIHVPELVMVKFVVEDHDSTSNNDLIGQYCLPLTSIQNGKSFVYGFNTEISS